MSKFVNKSKKNKDPYPITDTYQVAYNLVDAATVTITDLCENLSNNFDTHDEGIVDEMTNVDTRKFNSVSKPSNNSSKSLFVSFLFHNKNAITRTNKAIIINR